MHNIIDVHVHIGLEEYQGPQQVLRLMDADGIGQAVISPAPDHEDPDGVESSKKMNNLIADALRRWPDRFIAGFGLVEPRHGSACLGEVDRILGDLGLCGLMFHSDDSGISLDHPNTMEIVSHASRHKRVIILAHMFQHSILCAPFEFMNLADSFPEITFIAGNPMMTTTDSAAVRYMAKKCPNVYFDTAKIHSHLFPIERTIAAIGVHRLLFGSDNPNYTHNIDKSIIDWSAATDQEKQHIFHDNAYGLFLGSEG